MARDDRRPLIDRCEDRADHETDPETALENGPGTATLQDVVIPRLTVSAPLSRPGNQGGDLPRASPDDA
jgi:hypothetical protein